MKNIVITTLFALATTTTAFANGNGQLPPGANPPGNGHGCLNNPGIGCGPQPTPTPPPPPVTPPAQHLPPGAESESSSGSTSGSASESTSGSESTSTTNGAVSGENTGTFNNDGSQVTNVNVGVEANLGPVRASGGSGGSGGSATASGNGAGNTTNVTTENTTVYKRIEVPVLFNPVPPSTAVVGNIETHVTACGPLQQVIKTPVKGTYVGVFKNTSIDLGEDMELAPVRDEAGNEVYYAEKMFVEGSEKVIRRFGSQVYITTALPNVSGASTFSIGFAGSSGGGNGGAGSSSAMTRIVTKVMVISCELSGAYKLVQAPEEAKTAFGLTRDDLAAALKAAGTASK